MSELILASASPRRRALLEQIGVPHRVVPADICEAVIPGESPQTYTQRLALEKARQAAVGLAADSVILAADTTVALDGLLLGKPDNEAEAVAMLMALSGRTHQVMTGVAVISSQGEEVICVASDVSFAPLDVAQCHTYWQTGEPRDKAGAYAIQGLGSVFVTRLNGSYSNVVGLPLHETATLLQRHGVRVWQLDETEKEHSCG